MTTDESASRDPVEAMALIAGGVVRAFHSEYTGRQYPPAPGEPNEETIMVTLLDPIEDEATKVAAATARGALFQLMLALSDVACLKAWDFTNDADRFAHCDRVMRSLASAIDFFERAHGLDRTEIAGRYYAHRRFAELVADEMKWAKSDRAHLTAIDGGRHP